MPTWNECRGAATLLLSSFLIAGMASPAAAQTVGGPSFQATLPANVTWVRNPLLTGVASATIVGDPTKTGLYVLLGKMEAGARFPPHSHPDARITTVVSGTMYFGSGSSFDPEAVRAYPAGSIVHTPAGVPHFMWSKDGETIMQETGFGPTGMTTAN